MTETIVGFARDDGTVQLLKNRCQFATFCMAAGMKQAAKRFLAQADAVLEDRAAFSRILPRKRTNLA